MEHYYTERPHRGVETLVLERSPASYTGGIVSSGRLGGLPRHYESCAQHCHSRSTLQLTAFMIAAVRHSLAVHLLKQLTRSDVQPNRRNQNVPNAASRPPLCSHSLSILFFVQGGLDAGADNYVTKPYDPNYLLSRVDSLLKSSVQEKETGPGNELAVSLAGQTFHVKAGRQ